MRVITPLKDGFARISDSLASVSEKEAVPTPEPMSNSVTNINIQTITNDSAESVNVQRPQGRQQYRVEYVYPTTKPQESIINPALNNDLFKDVEERSRQSREASLRWFEEAKARSNAKFETDKARQQAEMDTWVKEMQAKTVQWKKDHGF